MKAPSRNGYKGIRQPARQVGKSVPPLQEKNGFNHESQQRFPPYSLLTSSVRALACASAAWRKDPPLSIGLELWITKCSSPSVSNKNCGAYRCNSYVVVVAKSSRLLLFFCCQLGWNSLSLSLSLVQNGKSSSADNFVALIAAAKMTIKCYSQSVIVHVVVCMINSDWARALHMITYVD